MWVMIIMVASLIAGYVLNKSFDEKYGSSALQLGYLVLQTVCLCIAIFSINGPWWLIIIGFASTIFSYYCGLTACKNFAVMIEAEEGDIKKAVAAQALIPLGAALTVVLIVALFLRGGKSSSRK